MPVGGPAEVERGTMPGGRRESGGPALGRASRERDARKDQPARNVTAVIDRLPISERQYLLARGGSMWAR
jgi:hypothetical protein